MFKFFLPIYFPVDEKEEIVTPEMPMFQSHEKKVSRKSPNMGLQAILREILFYRDWI